MMCRYARIGAVAIIALTCTAPLQAEAKPRKRVDTGVDYVGDLLASPRGALSLNGNVAGLATLDHNESRLQLSLGNRSVDGAAGNGWGLYTVPLRPVAMGASIERVGRADGDVAPEPGLLAVSRELMALQAQRHLARRRRLTGAQS